MPPGKNQEVEVAILRTRLNAVEADFGEMKTAMQSIARDVRKIQENITARTAIEKFINGSVAFIGSAAGIAVGFFTARH